MKCVKFTNENVEYIETNYTDRRQRTGGVIKCMHKLWIMGNGRLRIILK